MDGVAILFSMEGELASKELVAYDPDGPGIYLFGVAYGEETLRCAVVAASCERPHFLGLYEPVFGRELELLTDIKIDEFDDCMSYFV